jgi:hypothetical protein
MSVIDRLSIIIKPAMGAACFRNGWIICVIIGRASQFGDGLPDFFSAALKIIGGVL